MSIILPFRYNCGRQHQSNFKNVFKWCKKPNQYLCLGLHRNQGNSKIKKSKMSNSNVNWWNVMKLMNYSNILYQYFAFSINFGYLETISS